MEKNGRTLALCVGALMTLLWGQYSVALTFRLPPPGVDLVGKIQYAYARRGDTLTSVGRRYDVGYFEMREANPHIKHNKRFRKRTKVVIPTQFLLPPGKREGIVINLAELRLYYFPTDRNVVITEPIGIGKIGWDTPTGETTIVQKKKDPWWRPTANVRADALRMGHNIPELWPPGPKNPLGRYAMRLGWREYLIHGTNNPNGVGKRSSAGCIRMYPEDIKSLFRNVSVGTSVRIINEPIKYGWHNDRLILEVHSPLTLQGQRMRINEEEAYMILGGLAKERQAVVNWKQVKRHLRYELGTPQVVGGQYKAARIAAQ